MKFFYVTNLTEQSVKSDVLPWEFKRAADLPPIEEKVRTDKSARQEWYKDPTTKHYFYTALEGINENQRPGKTNPVHRVHAFVVDCDMPLPEERIKVILEKLPIKPSWKEQSLGGNYRLVWLLEKPLASSDDSFVPYLLEKASKWLHLDLLPGLDESAFTNFSRLFCVGDSWVNLGHPPIPLAESERFHFECFQSYAAKNKESNDVDIPLDQVAARLKELYPNFNWPGEFELLSHGPTFWAPGSTSPLSACVMKAGMYSHAAHAPKVFTPWADLLGAEFVRGFVREATASALHDVWFDGSRYWRKINGDYNFEDVRAFNIYLTQNLRLDVKKVPGFLSFLHTERRVDGVGPSVLHPEGIINIGNKKILNNWRGKVEQPDPDDGVDRPFGEDFQFMWDLLRGLIPDEVQRDHLLAWHQRTYYSALNRVPLRGHNLLIMGAAGVGKSLVASEILGKPVGGAVNASSYLVEGKDFQGNLFEYVVWLCEDDTPANNHKARQAFFARLKNMAANEHQVCNIKHVQQSPIISFSRIVITANDDDISAGVIPPLDDSSADKICLLEAGQKPLVKFTSNSEMKAKIAEERPRYLRALLKWKRPEHVQPEPGGERYGFKSYISERLRKLSHVASEVNPVSQLVGMQMKDHFRANPGVKSWTGTMMQLYSKLCSETRATVGTNLLGTAQLFNRHLKLAIRDRLLDEEGMRCETEGKVITIYRPENL